MATLLEVGCDAARAQETKLLENFDIDLHVVDSCEAGFGGGDVCGYWCWHCWWCRWWRRCVWRCWRAGGSVRGDWPGASRPPPPPPPPSPPPAAAQTVNDPEDWALQPPPASICSQAPRVSSPFTQKWEILLKMRCFLISVVWHFFGGKWVVGQHLMEARDPGRLFTKLYSDLSGSRAGVSLTLRNIYQIKHHHLYQHHCHYIKSNCTEQMFSNWDSMTRRCFDNCGFGARSQRQLKSLQP